MPRNTSDRYAVLIGINDYHESLGALQFCVNDAKLLQETLMSEQCGFARANVLLLTDDQGKDRLPTFGNIHSWLGTWLQRPKADDLVLVYFAGHGREHNGSAFLAPADATLESLGVTGIPIQYVREMLERCSASQKVLILDACHSGAGRDVATMSNTFKNELDCGKGLYTIASCDSDQISYEMPDERHGVFTWYLTEAIREAAPAEPDGSVTLDSVYDATRGSVLDWTQHRRIRQEPVRICRVSGQIPIASRQLTAEQRLKYADAEIQALKEKLALKAKQYQYEIAQLKRSGEIIDGAEKGELEFLRAEKQVREQARLFLEEENGSRTRWRTFMSRMVSEFPVLTGQEESIKDILDSESRAWNEKRSKQIRNKTTSVVVPEWESWLEKSNWPGWDVEEFKSLRTLYLLMTFFGGPAAGVLIGGLLAHNVPTISKGGAWFIGILAILVFGPGLAGIIHWLWLERYRNRYRSECAEICQKHGDITGASNFALAMGRAGVDKGNGGRLLASIAELSIEDGDVETATVLLDRAAKLWKSPHAKRMLAELDQPSDNRTKGK